MEAERSIVLQKKMILFLSLMIFAILGIIYGRENNQNVQNSYVAEVNELDLVTVNVSDDENEILRKNVKYLATKVIVEEESLSLAQFNNEKVEIFAGDVSGSVDTNLEILNEENVVVAVNNESTNSELLTNSQTENITIETEEEIVIEEKNLEDVKIEEIKKEETVVEQVKTEKVNTVRYRELAEDNPPTEYVSVVEASATAYCLCQKCCGKTPDNPYYGYTHSGIKIEPGTGMKVIAVDPSIIPLKSKVYVEGLNGAWDYGYAIAADTGSAIKQLKIDLYMDTHEEALQWGRKKVKVYVLGE